MGRMKIPDAASAPVRRPHLAPPFPKGVSGNPKGRIMGSRNKLTEKFIDDLSAFYEIEGTSLIKRVADEQPAMLLQVVARLLPKDLNLNVSGTIETELTVDQRVRIAEAWMLGRQSDRVDILEGEAVRCDSALPESLPDGKDDPELDAVIVPNREQEPVRMKTDDDLFDRESSRQYQPRPQRRAKIISTGTKRSD